MLKPTPGELVGGISRSLRAEVLAELPPGAAQRQLKAALHALDRVERGWGKLTQTLIEDNRDIAETVRDLVAGLLLDGVAIPDNIARDVGAIPSSAVSAEPADLLPALFAANETLQRLLVAIDPWLRAQVVARPELEPHLRELKLLYRRIVGREITAMAVDEISAGELEAGMRAAQPRSRKEDGK